MKEYNKIIASLKKNKEDFTKLQKDFQKLLNSKSFTFDEKLSLWKNAPAELKLHYGKIPTKNIKIISVFNEIADQLDVYSKTSLDIGLMDDIYIYEHDEFEEAIDSCSHLKTKKEFIQFMNLVFKYNIGTFN